MERNENCVFTPAYWQSALNHAHSTDIYVILTSREQTLIYNHKEVAQVPTAVHWLTVNKYQTCNQEQNLLTVQEFGVQRSSLRKIPVFILNQ